MPIGGIVIMSRCSCKSGIFRVIASNKTACKRCGKKRLVARYEKWILHPSSPARQALRIVVDADRAA